jgi:shikimate kinase
MLYYLIGMMGSGKTYYGSRLAERMQLPFIDLDAHIEEHEERSINAIFDTDGEGYFREIEAKHLRSIADEYEAAVISTGGGAPCFHDNMVWMRQTGHTIYLRVPTEVLVTRLAGAHQQRPLVSGLDQDQIHDKIEALIEKRRRFYEQAHETLDVQS